MRIIVGEEFEGKKVVGINETDKIVTIYFEDNTFNAHNKDELYDLGYVFGDEPEFIKIKDNTNKDFKAEIEKEKEVKKRTKNK